ncbi:MAG: aspartyl protease family protein [Candidatus Diapherotrites archaeon]|nr:aspartyl protease family protein [Candidatus Diapherotrites archaeon]
MNLNFNCKRQEVSKGIWVNEPIIPVTLIGSNDRKLNFTAVLDSGSDFILLPKDVAEALELEFDAKKQDKAKTYEGTELTTTLSKVKIEIRKGREQTNIECRCAILLSEKYQHEHIIFGSSFFDNFRINFDFPKRKFEIKNKTN